MANNNPDKTGRKSTRNFDLGKPTKHQFDLVKEPTECPVEFDDAEQGAQQSVPETASNDTQMYVDPMTDQEPKGRNKVLMWIGILLIVGIIVACIFAFRSCYDAKKVEDQEREQAALNAATENPAEADQATDTAGVGEATDQAAAADQQAEEAASAADQAGQGDNGTVGAANQQGNQAQAPDATSANTAAQPAAPSATPASAASASGSLDDLVKATIRGQYGNGAARRSALGDRYREVQAEVNRRLR